MEWKRGDYNPIMGKSQGGGWVLAQRRGGFTPHVGRMCFSMRNPTADVAEQEAVFSEVPGTELRQRPREFLMEAGSGRAAFGHEMGKAGTAVVGLQD